uniref:ATP synthase subunit a n=1 Tax=Chauliognathus opacus TaxID=528223 RepID=D1G5K0_CHAOP|nr:ATP synthase F0 subunit 6 [Chauliognathus opacus]ACM45015.1 ATP synthase F0 subunit 6 [Chauliognathus opacus]
MTNLFSSFDPSSSSNLSLNWLSMLLGMMFIPMIYWFSPSRLTMMWVKILNYIHQEFKILLNLNKMKGTTLMFVSLFSFILFSNFLSLYPYIFPSTSHMTLTLALSLPLWISFMIYGWVNNTIHMFAHLVPQGTPAVLMPFMVCIETISNVIRPGTLAIRLSANMIAGHLLLTLLGSTGQSVGYLFLVMILIIQFLLMILESAVAIIQSYVFSILSTLYSSEVN